MTRVPHPGEHLRSIVAGMSQTQDEIAQAMDVSRHTLNVILNEHRGVTPPMALRFERVLGIDPVDLLRRQGEYDIAVVQRRKGVEIARLKPLATLKHSGDA